MAEKDLYIPIKRALIRKLNFCNYQDIHVEITAEGRISNRIHNKFDHPFTVLSNKFCPDLIALYTQAKREKSISIEVKENTLTIKDIFQALSYGIILESTMSFLISPIPLDENIESFLSDRTDILHYNRNSKLYIGLITSRDMLDDGGWFPNNPF